jgi:NAD(P)-dependent dehydrogenase (short-subunit alcohol dehydrogenase family)
MDFDTSAKGNWEDKIVVVTGAAAGIGYETAKILSSYGARVLAVDINASKLAKSVQQCSGKHRAVPVALDISSEREVAKFFSNYASEPLAALLNVAGIMLPGIKLENLDSSDWDRTLNINVKSIFLMAKYALPLFRNNDQGVIVNVSSVHAFASVIHTTAYAASKGAVLALTRQLAIELAADKIRVVGIAPGAVNTEMTTRNLTGSLEQLNSLGIPTDDRSIGRLGEPSEIANAIIWAASQDASFVNGTTIAVDGGMLSKLF